MPLYTKRRDLTVEEKNLFPGYSELLAHLLFHRGITAKEHAERFLAPDYARDTHDPRLLKDAVTAAGEIVRTIRAGDKIAVYADYDCDGIPGAVMFHDLFRRIGFENFVIYIPHRHNEGFGLNDDAVTQLSDLGVKLLITVDCGISDFETVEHANKLGIKVIVTDHHEPPDTLPASIAVVDPKQKDCRYPDKNLCGTGVAFKLIQAILAEERFGLKDGHEKWLLDLVGIATMSDMVPLVGENRVFAHYGLQVLRKSPRKGLRTLLSKLKINQAHLTEDDIAFMITPRINAASRMGVPMDAFNMLAAETDESALKWADHLDHINNERKGVVASLVKEVKKILKERYAGGEIPHVIVLGNPDWRPSLLGLVANSCAEEFRRPVFLWGRDGDGGIKGSCRSEGLTHVVDVMKGVPVGTFSEYGGHKHSGGFGLSSDSVHHIDQLLNESAKKLLNCEGPVAADHVDDDNIVDCESNLDDVGYELYDDLNKLSPFGVGNKKPIFLFRGIVPQEVRVFGKNKDHVELVFRRSNGSKISAIAFFGVGSEWSQHVKANQKIDLVAAVEKSMFRNRPEIRLRVEDVIYS